MRGGVDEEMTERNRWIQAEQKKINDSVMGELKDLIIRGGPEMATLIPFDSFHLFCSSDVGLCLPVEHRVRPRKP